MKSVRCAARSGNIWVGARKGRNLWTFSTPPQHSTGIGNISWKEELGTLSLLIAQLCNSRILTATKIGNMLPLPEHSTGIRKENIHVYIDIYILINIPNIFLYHLHIFVTLHSTLEK